MYTVGLVPSPGVAHEHVTKIIPKIKQLLTERINDDSQWNFDVQEDLIIGSAEDVHESVDKAEQIKMKNIGISQYVLRTFLVFLEKGSR